MMRNVLWVGAWQFADHRIGGDSPALTLDAGDELLPWYTAPSYSPDSQTLAWTRTSAGRAPDAIYGSMYWTEVGDDDGGTLHWIVPPDASSFVFPVLPE